MLRICVLVGEFRKQREESEGEIQDAKVGFRFACPACKERVTGLRGGACALISHKKRGGIPWIPPPSLQYGC